MMTGLDAGTIFAGRYRVARRIAAGGMGAVYEVVHLETERRRALKVMLPHLLQSPELRERFQREAKVAAHIDSEFIVDVFDAGFDDATEMPFLVMELLRGEELGQRLKRLGRLSPAEVVSHLHQTALALDKTHKASIVHRDLKPENLFLTEREDGPPRIKVLDFGIAKVVAESVTAGAGTQSIGTPFYMAPEQYNPEARLTGAADRYALALVAYTLLVGQAYWADEAKAGHVLALAMTAVRGPREPASARAARRGVPLPPAFDAWFARGTAVDPAQRFGTSAELVAALADALGVPPPPRPAMMSASSAESAPWLRASAPALTPAPAYPPAAQVTAPATSTTAPVPAPSGRRAVAAVIGAAVLAGIGGGAVMAMRSGGAPTAAPAATAAMSAPAASAAPTASATVAESAAPSVTASADPPRIVDQPATPAVKAPAKAPPPKKKKYSRD